MNTDNVKQHKVLVVDSDDEVRRFLIILLISEDFEVEYATSGKEALEKLANTEYGAVLTEIDLPGVNGLSLIRAIKEKHRFTEVIMLSSKRNISDAVASLRYGAFDFFSKPFENIDLITNTVGQALTSYSIKKENQSLIEQLTETNRNLASIVKKKTRKLEESNDKLLAANEKLVLLQESLLEEKKLSALGSITAGFAHEINNPIQNILIYTELLMKNMAPDTDDYEFAKVIKEEVERISGITGSILNYSRKAGSKRTIINVQEFVNHLFTTNEQALASAVITCSCTCDPGHYILADRNELYQIFLNLLHNSLAAMQNGTGTITIGSLSANGQVDIYFSDSGCGIPEDIRERVFEPFFSTKEVGKGTGLGLFIAYNLVRKNKGSIEISDSSEKGTTFRLSLPAQD